MKQSSQWPRDEMPLPMLSPRALFTLEREIEHDRRTGIMLSMPPVQGWPWSQQHRDNDYEG